MKFSYFLLFLLPFAQILAQTQASFPSKIEKVTVFLSGAQVQRSATLTLQTGKHNYVFSGMSPIMNQQTLQVSGSGDFTILSAVQRIDYLKVSDIEQKTLRIQAQLDSMKDMIEAEEISREVWKSEESLLEKLQIVSNSQQFLSAAEITEAMSYREKRLIELKMKAAQSNKKLNKLQEFFKQYYQQLQEEALKQSKNTSEVTVTILATKSLSTTLTFSYFIDKAGWQPFYDFRVKDITKPMFVAYKANVFQQSGEDWKEIKLTLSTANPYQDNRLPNLSAWQMNAYNPQERRKWDESTTEGQLVDSKGRTLDSDEDGVADTYDEERFTQKGCDVDNKGVALDGDNDGVSDCFDQELNSMPGAQVDTKGRTIGATNFEMNIASLVQTEISNHLKKEEKPADIPIIINEKNQQTMLSYEIEELYTLIADGKYNMVEIKNVELPAHYQYLAIPKLQEQAFLLALIMDWEKYSFLEGEANLFFEDTYIGKSQLDLTNVGDTLRISLGQDKQVLVKRTRLKDKDSRQLIGNQQTASRSFEIGVRNTKKQTIEILIEDQFPLVSAKEVIIEKLDFKEGKVNEETGKVQWLLKVAPSEEKKLPLKYLVKYPKNWIVEVE